MTALISLVPVVINGKFENEFLRINVIASALVFTYFAKEHYAIRLLVTIWNLISIIRQYFCTSLCSLALNTSTSVSI